MWVQMKGTSILQSLFQRGEKKTEGKREADRDGEDWKRDKEDVSEKRKSPQSRTDTGCREQ